MTPSRKNIAILGAGLLGRLLAVELANAGCQVSVYDKSSPQSPQSAAFVAAAMLAPLAESVSTEESIVRMGYYSLVRWPKILKLLKEDVFFQQNGSLIVWHQQDASSAQHFKNQLKKTTESLTHSHLVQNLNKLDLIQLEPQLSRQFEEGIFLPEEGQLDNRELLDGLLKKGIELGVQYQWQFAVNVEEFPTDTFDHVIDCRGLGAKSNVPDLRGVRGEVIRIYAPEVKLTRPVRLIHPKYPIYIAPKRNHVYVIGATEIESEDDSPMSVRSALELLSAAYTVHSGFAEARILESGAQCRPSFKNNLPKIMLHKDHRFIHVNGLYRHGFLIAPAIVDRLLNILLEDRNPLANQLDIEIQDLSYDHIC
ncbi:cytochrome c biogenesis protein CcdA [Polynucleobacter sp. SHI8]|uniref:FAD-dependent oxidoreductase n=1 Tax=unclassified Polynucleobacter TaxID=2640945 RepID=UPI002493701B|nr:MULTISPECIES: FAD-dependent oxidoreductase [unclassified Polynucleobacter]BDW11007.1 cytochrome c biogenesis protein CcdA [Polynucleobacter sp. SHI2]BDW13453.1 cytochrome c biogenesis protein CcdA [Polynucleobacter sp. SHI8]